MARFMSAPISYVLLWPPLLRLNPVLYTTIAIWVLYFARLSKQWVTHNPRQLCIVIMPMRREMPITQLNASVHDQWKCTSSGSVTKLHKKSMPSAGIPAKRIWLIIKASIMWVPIMWLFALGTYK